MPLEFGPYPDTLEAALRRRGHRILGTGDPTRILLPEERLGEVVQAYWAIHGIPEAQRVFGPGPREQYHVLMAHSSFRKLARRLILAHGEPVPMALLRENAGDQVESYVEYLEAIEVVEATEAGTRCTRPLDNFGASLEHHVAQTCVNDLLGTAEWGVHLDGLPHAGGDYDVLSWLSSVLVYVECKAKRPGEIRDDELRHFLQRHVELAPDLTILLIDTSDELDDLVDRVNRHIQTVMEAQPAPSIIYVGGSPAESLLVRQLDYPGVWFGAELKLYATNAEPSILPQLRRCLQHYHALVRGRAIVPAVLPRFVSDGSTG